MSTLFQLHAQMNSLKAMVKELATLWHSGDSLLLLADTAGYLTWIQMYIQDLNHDDEIDFRIDAIDSIYVLKDDIELLNESAKLNIDFSNISVISDAQWVELTQQADKVVTLNSIS